MSESDELALLEGRGIGSSIESAAGVLGITVQGWRLLRIHHRPDAGVTGIFAVQSRHDGGVRDGFLCVTTAKVPGNPPRSVRVAGPRGEELLVWSHPHDPLLPGLPWASDARSVGPALFGIDAADITTVSYRPLRRAVLRAEGAGSSMFLKVLRRGQAAALGRRHELLYGAGVPVPQPFASPGKDVLVTRAANGVPLAERLMADGAQDLDPLALVELLERFPPAALELPTRQPWAARVRDYAKGAAAVLPAEAERITALASRVEQVVRSAPTGPLVPTHGDFYEGNLLVADGRVTGLLDVDGLGPGHLVDDLACFLAHFAVLPCLDDRYVHVPAAVARFAEDFETRVDRAALNARAAGVALTLVAGAKHAAPARAGGHWRQDAERRLFVAETFLNAARN
ncbi:hypothetical protein GCM10027403_21130 [Arthrobacter tecti]